jgi:hypothetical protein
MRKITAGFKCDPQLKEDLLSEAGEHGITLSEYLESLCENRHSETLRTEYISSEQEDSEDLMELRDEIDKYERMLQPLFEQHKGTETLVILPDGTETQTMIEEPADVLYALVNALKERP